MVRMQTDSKSSATGQRGFELAHSIQVMCYLKDGWSRARAAGQGVGGEANPATETR